jgi:hypothetical protein
MSQITRMNTPGRGRTSAQRSYLEALHSEWSALWLGAFAWARVWCLPCGVSTIVHPGAGRTTVGADCDGPWGAVAPLVGPLTVGPFGPAGAAVRFPQPAVRIWLIRQPSGPKLRLNRICVVLPDSK